MPPFSPAAVYDLLVDELGADHTLLNIRGETVGPGPGRATWLYGEGCPSSARAPPVFHPLVSLSRGSPPFLSPQALELAARLNRKELFYHLIYKNREICWQYGSRVNYNLDLRVVDGARRACSALHGTGL